MKKGSSISGPAFAHQKLNIKLLFYLLFLFPVLSKNNSKSLSPNHILYGVSLDSKTNVPSLMVFNSYSFPVNLCFNLTPSTILIGRYIPFTFSKKDPRCCFGNHIRTSPFSSSSVTTLSFSIFVILNRSWVNLFFSLSPTTIVISRYPLFSALTV
jgi:hypothetical protein